MRKHVITLFFAILSLMLSIALFMMYNTLNRISELAEKQLTKVKETEILRVIPDSMNNSSVIELPEFRVIAKEGTGTVVYIETEVDMKDALPKDGNHNFDEKFWDRFSGRPRSISLGSGVIITADGYILTNAHVVSNAFENRVTVVLNDNRSFDGQVIGVDASTDLAVVKVDGSQFKPIPIGDSDFVEIGDWVLAIGNPFRLRSTVTAGIVSALSRDVAIIEDRMRIESFIQTDAAINRGNSGGALVNHFGELIGINTAIATETGSYEGYGFAIPSNMAIKIAKDIIEFGYVKRAYLGVQIASVNEKRANELGLRTVSGVEIISTLDNGSAAKAGIVSGDVVLAINKKKVSAYNELQAKIAEYRPGDVVDVTLWSDGQQINRKVILQGTEDNQIKSWIGENIPTPGNVKDEDDSQTKNDTNGNPEQHDDKLNNSTSEMIPFSESLHFKVIQTEEGDTIFVDFIGVSDLFAKSGIKMGDQIIAINQKPILSVLDIRIHLQHYQTKKEPVIITVKRGNTTGYILLNED